MYNMSILELYTCFTALYTTIYILHSDDTMIIQVYY